MYRRLTRPYMTPLGQAAGWFLGLDVQEVLGAVVVQSYRSVWYLAVRESHH